MEFKGTKGGWYANHSEPIEVRSKNKSIAFVTIIDYENKDIEAHANAKLIAAAPELLEACQEMYQWFKNESTDGIQDDALELAKKAIDKSLK